MGMEFQIANLGFQICPEAIANRNRGSRDSISRIRHTKCACYLLKKRKQLLQLLAAGLAAVFADFKALGIVDGLALRFAVPRNEVAAVTIGFPTAAAEPGAAEPILAALHVVGGRDLAHVIGAAVGAPLVVLRRQLVNRVELLIENVVD